MYNIHIARSFSTRNKYFPKGHGNTGDDNEVVVQEQTAPQRAHFKLSDLQH